MSERPPSAIRSLREDDPELEERLDGFILGLGERVDELQDAETADDRSGLAELASELGAVAAELGYPALADAARRVVSACSEEGPEAAHKAVADLTQVSQQVRRGHRSSA